jgi:hypothetical protein
MSFAATALHISSGAIIWVAHFAAIYGFTALACARNMPQLVLPAVAIPTFVAVALLVVVLFRGIARRKEFESWMSATVAAFSLLAVVWEAMPVFMVPACG